MTADEYNEHEISMEWITPAHVTELTRRFQQAQGLPVDGKLGPTTRALLELLRGKSPGDAPKDPTPAPDDLRIQYGCLVGPGVGVIPIHRSWYYPALSTPGSIPLAIVAHNTATSPGTAVAMARNRAHKFISGTDRAASWHVSIEADGSIIQMAPFTVGCWHAGGKTALPIKGVGPANHTAIGVELVGYGDAWPEAQVSAAARVWRALVQTYGIKREHAMVTHAELDPIRKRDPGELWLTSCAPGVLDYAYSAR